MTTAQTDRGTDGDGRSPGRPGPHDFLNVDAHLSEEEKAVRAEARAFVEDRIRPNIRDWFEKAHFPRELIPEMGTLGLLGMHLKGYGCAGKSAVAYGLACMELEAGAWGVESFLLGRGPPGEGGNPQVRPGEAEEGLAPANGARRSHRLLRPH